MTRSRQAFEIAQSRLNGKNLTNLWLTHCMLSLLDYYGSHYDSYGDRDVHPLFPMLNPQRVRLFGDAIIASRALEYKDRQFRSADAAIVFDNLTRASYDIEMLREDDSEPEDRLLKLIAPMANAQFRFQEGHLHQRLGREYAMLDQVPRLHRD